MNMVDISAVGVRIRNVVVRQDVIVVRRDVVTARATCNTLATDTVCVSIGEQANSLGKVFRIAFR
jgi:hypothetical protein